MRIEEGKSTKTEASYGITLPTWLGLGAFVWFALAAIWATWTPIQLTGSLNRPLLFPPTTPAEIVSNLLLLAPVGFVTALVPWRHRILAALAAGAALSLVIEAGQAFLVGRVVSLTDLLLNTAGAGLGGAAGLALGRRIGPRVALGVMGALVFCALLAFSVIGAGVYGRQLRLAGWDASYPIVAGDEAGGGKAYVGQVIEARICAGTDPDAVCAMADAQDGTRQRLAEVAEATQHLEVFARVVPATNDQWGPTRIITFSNGWYRRNVTLGQEGSALVLRLRTPLMGPNGRGFEIWVPRAFEPGDTLTVHAQFDHGAVTTDLTTADGTRQLHHSFDVLSAGLLLRGSGSVTPVQVRTTRLLGGAVLIIPLLLLAGTLVGYVRHRVRRNGSGA